jgi:hypothetical protein
MPREKRSDREFDAQLPPGAGPAAQRRVQATLKNIDRESIRANDGLRRQLRALRATYRGELEDLLGGQAIRELDAIRRRGAKLSRSQRKRQSQAVLDAVGVDRARIAALRLPSLAAGRDILSGEVPPVRAPDEGPCTSPWVTYSAPYSGYSWSFNWRRSSNPDNPALTRYLDPTTGRIGSSIATRVSGAGDDDDLEADYYTSLHVWHTPLATGPLEVYLAFEFTGSTYRGKVTDETGFSDAIVSQFARARLFSADAQDPIQRETQESLVYNFIDTVWGDDLSWSTFAFKPRDRHWYYFKTAAAFQRGSHVLLEAGIRHLTWFEVNDQSVSTEAILDLRLDRIMVRSCEGEIIL